MNAFFEREVEQALRVLQQGGVILYPTDTIWGLGCDATDAAAIQKIYEIKNRPDSKSLIILVADALDIMHYVAAPDPAVFDYIEQQQRPTTIVFQNAIALPDILIAADGSIAIRVVQDDFCRHLVKRLRKPLVSTSANSSGQSSPQAFHDISDVIKQNVDHIVKWRQDDTTPAQPSQVVRWNKDGTVTVLRARCSVLSIFARMYIPLSKREETILQKVASAAQALQLPCYLIGGFVRDKILGRPTKDADFVCIGDGLALANKAATYFAPAPKVSLFKTFGTAQFRLHDGFELEFVGARRESYQLHSRNPEVMPGTLEDDQNRRDFTINALAVSLNKADYGALLDPFNGLQDLEHKIIRTPLEPDTTFSDDPLRMMRAIRFASQLHFTIEPNTFEAIKRNAHRIKIISQERITDELNKIILSKKPSVGFKLLYDSGLLQLIFPQMVALAGAEYIDGKGHKDNFYHTLQVLDNVAHHTNDLWLRWAAILHDIAKPATKRFEEGHGWTFHGHEVVGGRMVPKIFAQLKLPMADNMRFVKKLVELHLRPIGLAKEEITDSAMRRLLFDAGQDFEALMLLCESDVTSKNKQKAARYLENFELVKQRCYEVEEKDAIRNWQPPITGELIMATFGLKPSKQVGLIKDAIREAILDGAIPNDYNAAYQYMLEKGKEYQLAPVN